MDAGLPVKDDTRTNIDAKFMDGLIQPSAASPVQNTRQTAVEEDEPQSASSH
jgi:hypothetical protein